MEEITIPCLVSGLPHHLKDPQKEDRDQGHVWEGLSEKEKRRIRDLHLKLKTHLMLENKVLKRLGLR